jgi:hypothetical protein
MINNNFHHKTVVQVTSLTLFLILNFSQGGLLLVDNAAFCDSLIEPLTEPGDIPVVPNVMGRVPDQLPELISSNSDVTWFSCFWSFFSE